ncbi:MAG: HipA family kinase [Pseudomonadales bacterium]
MAAIIQIEEIIRPAEQGLTKPFLCRAEDGYRYYVKGRSATRAGQCHEWLCAHLGRALGLPIPEFSLVEVPAELLAEAPTYFQPLGAGVAFASRECAAAQWLEPSLAVNIPQALRRDVAVFDWWIRNEDRNAGNPNLLLNTERELVVIDHNKAFDADFNAQDFLSQHLFAAELVAVMEDFVEQGRYARRLSEALAVWEEGCHNIPASWHWVNDEEDIPAGFDLAAMRQQLARCESNAFWSSV